MAKTESLLYVHDTRRQGESTVLRVGGSKSEYKVSWKTEIEVDGLAHNRYEEEKSKPARCDRPD